MFHALLQILQFHHHHRPFQRSVQENFRQRFSPIDTAEGATECKERVKLQLSHKIRNPRRTIGDANFFTPTYTRLQYIYEYLFVLSIAIF